MSNSFGDPCLQEDYGYISCWTEQGKEAGFQVLAVSL